MKTWYYNAKKIRKLAETVWDFMFLHQHMVRVFA